MTIDNLLQARLLLGAFLCGLGVGCLFDCGTLLSVFLGAYCPPPFCAHLYARKLPVIGRAVGCGISRVRGAWSRVLRCLGTFLLPVTAAVCLLLLLFLLYRGVFRIGAPLCMLLGFALWRTYISLPIARVIALRACALSALLLYVRAALLWPFLLVWRILLRALIRPLGRLARRCAASLLAARSRRLCARQLALAANGLLPHPRAQKAPCPRPKMNKGKKNIICQKIKTEEARPHPSR